MEMNIRQRKVLRADDVMKVEEIHHPVGKDPNPPSFFESDRHVSLYLESIGSPWPRANCPKNWAPGYGEKLDHV